MVSNSILRNNARAQLGDNIFANNWLMILLAYVVYSALMSAAGAASLGIATIIISGPLLFGFYRILVNMVKGKPDVDMGEMFCGFTENFVQSMLLSLMTGIFTFLWSLLFVFPGIVKAYSYSMAMFIMQDDPSKDWEECLDESKKNDGRTQVAAFLS